MGRGILHRNLDRGSVIGTLCGPGDVATEPGSPLTYFFISTGTMEGVLMAGIPTTAVARYDLGVTVDEFGLVANQMGFVGPQVLRPKVVSQQAGNWMVVPENELNMVPETQRAPDGGYRQDNFQTSQDGYNCQEHGREFPMSDATMAMFADVFDAEATGRTRMVSQLLHSYEAAAAAAVFNTTTWTGASLTTALGTPWSTHASATPIADVQAAKEKGIALGVRYNALVCSERVFWHLCQSDELEGKVSANKDKTNNTLRSLIAELLDVEEIITPWSLKNTANQGQTAAAYSRIWATDKAMVCKVAKTDDPAEVCIGRTFLWNGDGATAGGDEHVLAVLMEMYRKETARCTVLRGRHWRGLKIMYPRCGHLLTNVAAN